MPERPQPGEWPRQHDGASSSQEPSILEYARLHGICKDHTLDDPLNPRHLPPPPVFLSEELADPLHSARLELPGAFQISERFELNAAGVAMLKAACAMPAPSADAIPSNLHRIRDLRVELPVLKSDNELDMRRFLTRERLRLSDITLPLEHTDDDEDQGLPWPSKHRDLPARYHAQAASERIEIPKDALLRLQDSLRDDFKHEYREALMEAGLSYQKNHATEPVTPPLLPMDPPLDPFPDPRSSSPAHDLELLSEDTNYTTTEIQALEAVVFKDDCINTDDTAPAHASSLSTNALPASINDDEALASEGANPYEQVEKDAPQDSDEGRADETSGLSDDPMLLDEPDQPDFDCLRSMSERPPKRRAADFKVEGPLTPPLTLQPPTKKAKTVSFPDDEMLYAYIPDAHELPSAYENGNAVLDSENEFDPFFKNDGFQIADRVMCEAEQEQLQEVDTTRRVDVPVMDSFLPTAPWDEYGRRASLKQYESETELSSQKRFLLRCTEDDTVLGTRWGGTDRLDKELSWTCFPLQLGKVALGEKIEDETTLAHMVAEISLSEVVDSASLTWKPDGLRILDDIDEDEDEVEPGTFGTGVDMESLVRTRKLEMQMSQDKPPNKSSGIEAVPRPIQSDETGYFVGDFNGSSKQKIMATLTDGGLNAVTRPDNSLMFGGTFSVSSALSKFMQVQSGITNVDNPEEGNRPAQRKERPLPHGADASTSDEDPQTSDAAALSQPATASLPTPQIPKHLPAQPFIISSTLLAQHRDLTRRIQTLYPTADLIERDSSTSECGAPSPEADITMSPAAGLLITSLQKIKQRALPGQTSARPTDFRTRVAGVAGRHERLIVLVSEGRRTGAPHEQARTGQYQQQQQQQLQSAVAAGPFHTPDARDCEALAALSGFAAGLDADVTVTYVAGGDAELALWIVGTMAQQQQHGHDYSSASSSSPSSSADTTTLLPEETLWELVLRRAGLNAFAAQVVLARLKPSTGGADAAAAAPAAASGLAAFVGMSAGERARLFGGALGGERVLERVSRVLGRRWVSAADGFAGAGVVAAGR